MPNYTKLFNSIVTSTIWTEDDKTRIVWITMLAIADQNGEVHASIPGLARLAGVSLESTESAINRFLSPDEYSRTPDNEGRRVAKIDGGWELLNYSKYRIMASLADKKDSNAKRQKRFRDRNASVTPVTHSNASVTPKTDKAEAEAEAEEEKKMKMKMKSAGAPSPPSFSEIEKFAKSQPIGIADECIEAFFDEMEALEWTYKGMPCIGKTAWNARFRKWATSWANNANRKTATK